MKQPDFIQVQKEMANSIRERRMPAVQLSKEENWAYYQDLIFNIFNEAINSAFPLLSEWIGEDKLTLWIKDFLRQHPVREHANWDIANAFRMFIQKQIPETSFPERFISDLLDFEWLEMELHLQPDSGFAEFRLIHTLWPLDQIAPGQPLPEPSDLLILLFRCEADGEIMVKTIHPLLGAALELAEKGSSTSAIAKSIAAHTGQALQDIQSVLTNFFNSLKNDGFQFSHEKVLQ